MPCLQIQYRRLAWAQLSRDDNVIEIGSSYLLSHFHPLSRGLGVTQSLITQIYGKATEILAKRSNSAVGIDNGYEMVCKSSALYLVA